MSNSIIQLFSKLREFDNHRCVSFFKDPQIGLRGYIAIHRGGLERPAFGATRLWKYETETDALRDALKLSRMMSYKSALAGLQYGGAKSVIIEPKNGISNRSAFLEAYANKVNYLNGRFVTGTDVGLCQSDVEHMQRFCSSMVGLSVNPTIYTGLGVYYSLQACLSYVYGSDSFTKRTFAIQGAGKIGSELLKLIYKKADRVYVADIDKKTISSIKKAFPRVAIVKPSEIHKQNVDVYVPCALSNAITNENISELRCKIIAGGANNQLESEHTGTLLHALGILYAPDYVVNAGGLISVVDEYEHKNHNAKRLTERIGVIKKNITGIIEQSSLRRKATNLIADEMAEKIFNTYA